VETCPKLSGYGDKNSPVGVPGKARNISEAGGGD
jgi:hypothetical protein